MLIAKRFVHILKSARLLTGLVLVLFSSTIFAQTLALLESPAANAFVRSGVGLIRGWACDAQTIEISINGGPRLLAGYGTQRGDTESVCGDRNNGFGLTYNWNNVGDGVQNVRAFVDGVEFANVDFTVTTLGEDFIRGLIKNYLLPNFPGSGQSAPVRWSEAHQNFVLAQSTAVPTPPNPPPPAPRAVLESPTQGSYESGVGLIRGWVCDATQVEISIDGQPRLPTAYGTPRGDTESVCGDRNNGFGLTFNWNNLGDGVHTLQAWADGVEFASVHFAVTTLGADFLTGLDRKVALADFPQAGQTTTIRWSEPDQNFTLAQTTATPPKLAIVSLITDLRNAFTVAGAGADSPDTTGVRAAKDAQGQPTQLQGVAWADTRTGQAADIQLTADGLPATYTDSAGVEARFSALTDTTTTVTFHDAAGNVQAGPVTVPIDGNLILALQEMARRVFNAAQSAEIDEAGRQLASSAPVAAALAAPTATAAQVFNLNQLLANVYWYGSLATGETVCAVGRAAATVGVRNLIAPTACQSPLLTALRARLSARQGQIVAPEGNVDPLAQEALRFDDDVVEAPCDPATDPAGCLIAPTVQLKAREEEVGPPILPEDAPQPAIPAIPSNVQASDGLFPDQVQITWTAVSGATTYQIYRATTASGGGSLLGQSGITRFNDPGVTLGVTYWYSVKACNSAGCSDFSSVDSGFAQQQVIVPETPTGVAASDGSFPDRVRITWSAVAGATTYEVYRSDSAGGGGNLLGQTASTLFEDTTTPPDAVHWYAVRACNDVGCSGFSSADSGFVQQQIIVPETPTGVAASDGVFPDRVRITWSAVVGATTYEVYRSDSAGGGGNLLGQTASPFFEDTTTPPGVIHWYSVRACNSGGCSGFSSADSGFAQAQSVESGLWSGSTIQFFVSPDGQQITSTGSPLRFHDGTIAAIILGPVNISGCPYPVLSFSVSGDIPITDSRFSYSVTFTSGITLLIEGNFSSPTVGNGSYLVGGDDMDDNCSPRGSGSWSAAPSGQ